MSRYQRPFSASSNDDAENPSHIAFEDLRGQRPTRTTFGHRLRTLAVAAVFGFSAVGGLGGAALADDDDDDGSATMTAAPPAGMAVQVAEDDGVAQLTVYGMRDTTVARGDDDDDDGDGTSRYVLVDIEVRNAGDAPFVFNTTRVRLHDAIGTAYTRVALDADDEDDDFGVFRQLRGQELNGDDNARGWLVFSVDDDSPLQAVSYRDDDGDDVGIANLTVAAIQRDDDDDWDDDGIADDGRGAGNVASSGDDDDDDDGYSGGTAPAPVTGGGYVGGDDDGYDGDGGGYVGGDDDWDDDGYDDDDDGYSGGDDDWDDDDGGDDDDGDDD